MDESASKEITVPDIPPDVFREMLKFVYTDERPEYDGETSVDLLRAADKYGLDDLKLMVEAQLCSHIDSSNVVEVLIIAERHNCCALMRSATAVFRSYGAMVAEDKWEKLEECPKLLRKLLQHCVR